MNSPTQPTTSIRVTPRHDGDPAPDLLGITLAHRAMITDVGRVAELTEEIAEGRILCAPNRAKAVARYVDLLCDSIHHHHRLEDQVLWPVINASAGTDVDLTELTEDHTALDPRLDGIRALAKSFGLSGGHNIAAIPLKAALRELHTMLRDHVADEERELFPVIRRHVSVANWAMVEKAAQRGGRLSFDGPRTLAVMTGDERAALTDEVSPVLLALIKLMAVRHRRFERRVFG
ncbi:hemerythrin domain-containing protein [Mycobacterium sp. DL99]|uniref:hemerythrin domain-containing protein n=1 Tax=Mycobacterium sp. DL99 TaxID=2528957 RepID=UPI00107FDC99|nr:hemerythrin domain-containing protein [Mycobacterium sp. DL99]